MRNFLGSGLLGLSLMSWRGESTPGSGSRRVNCGELIFMVDAWPKLMLDALAAKPFLLFT